jgi:HD domain
MLADWTNVGCATSFVPVTFSEHTAPRHGIAIKVPKAPGAGTAGRTLLARWSAVLLTAALAPPFVIAQGSARWDEPVLLVALAAIALVSLWGLVSIRPSVFMDAEFVAVLLALGFLGPLPAACVWLAAEAVYFVLSTRPVEAHVANIASYGWGVLAGFLVLQACGVTQLDAESGLGAYAALGAAGVAMLCVNFAVARGIVGVILNRQSARMIVREELIRPAPATLAMIGAGIVTAFLYTRLGVLALALFSVTVVIPQYLLPVLLRPRLVSEIPYAEAVALYARAIAHVRGLDRPTMLMLEDAATFLDIKVFGPVQGRLRHAGFEHWAGVQETLLFYREHWDAPGGVPGALQRDLIPLTSRILSVAEVWARLTAKGSPELTHLQALSVFQSRAGYHFDPGVVEAAAEVIERERLGRYGDSTFEPQLHSMPLPKLVAKLRTPAVGVG